MEIAAKADPRVVYPSNCVCTKAQTCSNGDVEIVANMLGGGQNVLALIPKEKRAELADFLVHAQD